jgi:hypothetical protein
VATDLTHGRKALLLQKATCVRLGEKYSLGELHASAGSSDRILFLINNLGSLV